ncbi:23582_t:CDS:2, partial [Dentiscutata erythropus]
QGQKQSHEQEQSYRQGQSHGPEQLHGQEQLHGPEQLHGQLKDQLHGQVQDQLHGQVQDQSHGQVQDQSHGQVQDQSHGQVQVQSHRQVQVQLHGQVQDQSHGQVQVQSHGQVQVQLHEQVQVQSHGQVQVQLHGQVQDPQRKSQRLSNRLKSNLYAPFKPPSRILSNEPQAQNSNTEKMAFLIFVTLVNNDFCDDFENTRFRSEIKTVVANVCNCLDSLKAKAYREFLVEQKKFRKQERIYQFALLKLFQAVSNSSDYNDTFVTYDKIKNEGNNDFKYQVKFKMSLHLLAGAGCKQNIVEGCKHVIEAERLGSLPAKKWTNDYRKKNDYGAEEACKLFR